MAAFSLTTIGLFVLLTVLRDALSEDAGSLPRFVEKVPNITVTVGRDALLPCTVEQLKSYKVAWVQVDTQTILTIHKQVITRNPRISLLHNDHRTWHLELKNVQESDRGWYMCQVNTDPMESQKGYVDVVVPPDIIDRESSGDLTVREGQDVNLTCRAKGHPTPNIVWRREDNQKIVLDAEKTASVVEGETLTMKKVSRLQMGSYLCIASNGIPPSISKRTHLRVQFPPVAWVPQQLEGAYVGQELTIECHTEAFPKSINYWTNTKGDMIVAGERFEPIVTEGTYKVYMELRIRRVEPEDYGTFKCIAKNSLGETDGAIKVYQIETPKAHSNSVSSSEEPEGASGESPVPTSTRHLGKDHKKYENYPHPKGVNDISDEHRRAKSQVGKGSGHLNTLHRGRQPGYPVRPDQDSGARSATPHLALLLLLPLFSLAFCPPFRLLSLPWSSLRL